MDRVALFCRVLTIAVQLVAVVLKPIRAMVGRTPWIGWSAGDCAPAPSHTTGRAVFRIRRLNPATLICGKM